MANLSSLAAAMRSQAQAIDPNEPIDQVVTMDQRLSNPLAERRFQTLLPSLFAGCSFSDQMPVRHEVAISTVILEFQEITLRSAVSTLPRHASLATAGCEALGTI
jgi:hypothetical protein